MKRSIDGNGIPPIRTLWGLAAAFGLAAIHQVLFFEHDLGISIPLFVCLFYLYIGWGAPERIRRPISGFGWFSLAVVLLLSLTFAVYANPLFKVLNVLVLPCLVFAQTTYILNPRERSWSDLRLIGDILDHMFPQNLRHLATVFHLARSYTNRKIADRRKQAIGKVLLGVLIAFPLLVIVVGLLTSADSSFDRLLSRIPDWLNASFSFGDGFIRVIYVLVLGLLLFGYLWGFVSPRPDSATGGAVPAENKVEAPVEMPRLDPLVAATVLILINIVYVLFASLQFSYLFGAWQGALPADQSYAEYARSGFFELIAVSAINFAILAVMLTFGSKAGKGMRRLNDTLLYILVACSAVMLVSAFTRLLLYEEAYGYTYIRFLSHAFMLYLAVLLVCAGLRIRFAALPLAKCFIVVSLAAYVALNYANMDRVIASKNIERYRETGQIDVEYLASLSPDAVPGLLKFSRQTGSELDPQPRTELNRRLHERWDHLAKGQPKGEWQSLNLAESQAIKALRKDKTKSRIE
ncbi:DUF4153 domain-containing protein [Paenibacillus rubinfantis]|uniref:DUF4153 domain-containing protein n=1 Tax=Paenibacillus rubinfantis TaxID=1720296 RepID=UPI00073F5D13|nr:DUF4173 domain-containing protein [Paenibacillus rubinfantis]